MNSKRRWQAFISALFAILIMTARADAATPPATPLENLFDEFDQLEKDIFAARRHIGAGSVDQCLNELEHYIDKITMTIDYLDTFATITASIKNKSDQQMALVYFDLEAGRFLRNLDTIRKAVNSVAGVCSSNYVVAAKAQEALRLFTKANSLVGSMLPAATAAR